jgi:hypothetical protein
VKRRNVRTKCRVATRYDPDNSAKSVADRCQEIAEIGRDVLRLGKPTVRGELPMWKAPVSVVCGWLAALPLIGCAGDVSVPSQTAMAPTAPAGSAPYYAGNSQVYPASVAAPAAVLVFLPTAGPASGGEVIARDPSLWADQGFGVVVPLPADVYRMIADQQAALSQLVASAHALADAPVWLVGSTPAIDAVLATAPEPGRGAISGVVVTSVTSNAGSCSESVFYANPGNGAAPTVKVERSPGCAGTPPAASGRYPSTVPAVPGARPRAPRIIEASAVPNKLPPQARVRRLAELIKAAPSS